MTCCCSAGSAAHLDTHAANCAGRCAAGAGCLRVGATAVSLDEVPGAPATYVTTAVNSATGKRRRQAAKDAKKRARTSGVQGATEG